MIRLVTMVVLAAPAPPCHEGGPRVPAAELEEAPPSAKQAGAGVAHDPVTTTSKAAQAAYDRGLALLHVYDWIRASRSFHEALRQDPKLALAHLGLSLAQNGMNDTAAARQAWAAASSLSAKASPRERARIEAWGKALDAFEATGGADRFEAYRASLDAALEKWPDDAELLLLRGNAAAPLPPGMGPYQSLASVPFFERVLAKAPDHPGAHHYLAHAFENEGRFADALPHAAALAKVAPGAPHAIHMHGHALLRTGRVAEAIARFEETDRVGAGIRAAESVADAHDWHHSHNLYLLASAYRYEGRVKEAEAALRRLAAIPPASEDAELDRRELASFLLARGRAAEALAEADVLSKGRLPELRAIGHALAGEALFAMGGRVTEAKDRLDAARREHAQITGERATTRAWMASLYADELACTAALSEGRRAGAREIAGRLIANHRAMRGPDGWVQALFRLEHLAVTAREAGDWELAATVTAAMAEHAPDYGGTHLAAAALAEHEGRKDVAARERALATKAWPRADAP